MLSSESGGHAGQFDGALQPVAESGSGQGLARQEVLDLRVEPLERHQSCTVHLVSLAEDRVSKDPALEADESLQKELQVSGQVSAGHLEPYEVLDAAAGLPVLVFESQWQVSYESKQFLSDGFLDSQRRV